MRKPPATETATARVKVTRWAGGVGAPMHGFPCFELNDGNQMYGFNLEVLTGELGEGAEVEVSVRVIKRGRTIHNPWLRGDGKPNYRATRVGQATAKTCHLCNPARRRR